LVFVISHSFVVPGGFVNFKADRRHAAAASAERSIKRRATGRRGFGHTTIFGRLTKMKRWAYAVEDDGGALAADKKR
jgi:hypothetical protein